MAPPPGRARVWIRASGSITVGGPGDPSRGTGPRPHPSVGSEPMHDNTPGGLRVHDEPAAGAWAEASVGGAA